MVGLLVFCLHPPISSNLLDPKSAFWYDSFVQYREKYMYKEDVL